MAVPGGNIKTAYLHEAPVGEETSDELLVSVVGDGGYTILGLGVADLTGTIVVQGRILDDEWFTIQVTDFADESSAASITADGNYKAVVAGLVAIRSVLTGSGVMVKANLVA